MGEPMKEANAMIAEFLLGKTTARVLFTLAVIVVHRFKE